MPSANGSSEPSEVTDQPASKGRAGSGLRGATPDPAADSVQVIVEIEADDDEIARLGEVLRRYGIEADVRAGLVRLSEGPLPASTDIFIPIVAFLSAFAAAAGADAYRRVRAFVQDVNAARSASKRPAGTVHLRDLDHHFELLLQPNLDEDAYRALFELDLDQFFDGGIIWFDPETRHWRAAGR